MVRCRPLLILLIAGLLVPIMRPPYLAAREDASALCIDAARSAASTTGVPVEVLLAISLVETGRNDRPWPWTINVGGEGHWFDTAREAEAHAQSVLDQGLTNLDLGCFQLNVRWHSKGFSSLSDMLAPASNATYAAEFLAQQYEVTGDWAAAAAAYHSQTPEHAYRYRAKFEAVYAALEAQSATPANLPDIDARENRFPLLLSGTRGQNGSLFPATGSGARLIGDN